jgi:guanylate kinase
MTKINRRGFMLVLSSPSGAGKTSIATKILEVDKTVNVSISVTTRTMRPGEKEGIDYFFVSKEKFQDMLKNNELLEHADVFENSYGTPRQYVFDTLSNGKDIIFDIDWQGTQQLAQLARVDLVSIFILPPSLMELEKRLNSRAQDSQDVIMNRMKEASNEVSHWAEYDYVIVNENLEKSVEQVHAIITAERLKRTRQRGLLDFVNKLRGIN